MMKDEIRILSFSGSLRKQSYNRILLNEMIKLKPENVLITEFDISPIPLYNEDIEVSHYPKVVTDFKDKIRNTNGVLIVTPEYNYSIPGVLKNAIDWASRPPTDIPFIGKPGAILGTSISMFGSLRSQLHLRQVLFAVGMHVMNSPEVYIPKAKEIFETGALIDERTITHLKKFWDSFILWINKINKL
jgi:chromate reductase, NAD(P)H dehydrogenase (quinone)